MIRATLTPGERFRLIRVERTDEVLSTREVRLGDTPATERPVQHEALWALIVSPVSQRPPIPPSDDSTLRIVSELGDAAPDEGDLISFGEVSVALIPVSDGTFRADFLGRGLQVVERRQSEGGDEP
jgi:hypothetical protein